MDISGPPFFIYKECIEKYVNKNKYSGESMQLSAIGNLFHVANKVQKDVLWGNNN